MKNKVLKQLIAVVIILTTMVIVMVAMSLFRINKAELSGAQYMARYWRLYAAGVAYEVIGAIVVQRLNIKIQKGVNQLYELLFKNS